MHLLARIFRRRQIADELAEEMQLHLEEKTEALMRSGLSRATAEREARLGFGNLPLTEQRSRAEWQWPRLERLWADFRYALRGLRNAPGYTVTIVLTLALGLSAATTMLAIVDSVLLRPVTLPHLGQLVVLHREVHGKAVYSLGSRQVQVLDEKTRLFSSVSGYVTMLEPAVTSSGARVELAVHVQPDFFRVLDIPATYGRALTAADQRAPVVAINDAFWRDRLHADPHAVGAIIKVAGEQRTIVGIMPPEMHFPQSQDFPAIYVPEPVVAPGNDHSMYSSVLAIGRLKPGVSLQQAQQEAQSVFTRMPDANSPDTGTLRLQSYGAYLTGDERPALLALLGGGLILLLIACGNSANLQIARITGRFAEMNVRSALGASFGRLTRQIVTESVTVSLIGGVLGMALTCGAVQVIRDTYGMQFARFDELTVHPVVFLACALLATLVGILSSILPAWNILRNAGMTGMASTARATSRSRVPGTLVAVQIALTCVLLVVTGLFVRTFSALQNVRLGFDPHGVTSLVLMPQNQHQGPEISRELVGSLLDRFSKLPGVQAATMQSGIPFSSFDVTLNGRTDVSGRTFQKDDTALYSLVSSNFVQASGMQLVRGRSFLPQDDGSAAVVCLVNEAFVQKYLQGRDPIGASVRFHRDPGDKDEDMPLLSPMTVVGVLNNELQGSSLGAPFEPLVYLNYKQLPPDNLLAAFVFNLATEFAIRSPLPQAAIDAEIRAAVKQTAPSMTEMSLQPMEQSIANSLGERRLALHMVSSFGFAALLLSAIGIYGVLAYAVARRRREIGIRMALGSSRAGATRLVTRQAATMVAIGIMLGAAGSFPASRAVRSFLFGVHALDPFTIATTAFVLLLVCAIAAAVPAWRAAQVDPIEVLRTE